MEGKDEGLARRIWKYPHKTCGERGMGENFVKTVNGEGGIWEVEDSMQS